MAMGRRIAIIVFALGTIVGYGSGIARIAHAHRAHCADWHSSESPSSR
jgi:hypothetical protein